MKLNGWQRLWVVFAAVWLLVCGVQFFKTVPGEETARRNARAEALSELPDRDFDRMTECMKNTGTNTLDLDNLYYQYCDVYSRRLTPDQKLKLDQRIAELLPSAKHGLLDVQTQYLGIFLGVWLVCIALVYGVGWVAAWVLRGFRNKAS